MKKHIIIIFCILTVFILQLQVNTIDFHRFDSELVFRLVRRNIGLENFPFASFEEFRFISDVFFDGNEQAAISALKDEAEDTGRTIEEILKAEPSGFNPITEHHNIVILGGGSGSKAIADGISNAVPGKSIGMVPTIFDNGGDSKNIQDAFWKKFNTWLFSIGDAIAMLLGQTDKVKSSVLDWRVPTKATFKGKALKELKEIEARFKENGEEVTLKTKNEIIKTLEQYEGKSTSDGESLLPDDWKTYVCARICGEPLKEIMEDKIAQIFKENKDSLPEDWLYFVSSIINLAKDYDKQVLEAGILDLKNASIKNRIFLAQLIKSKYLKIDRDVVKIDAGNLDKAFSDFAIVLGLKKGYVIPSSNDKADLVAFYKHGVSGESIFVVGQSDITEKPREDYRIVRVDFAREAERGGIKSIVPQSAEWPSVADGALKIIKTAEDVIIVGPGSTATSLIPNLLLRGRDGGDYVAEALMKKDIPRLFILNPVYTNETRNYDIKSLIVLYKESIEHALGYRIKMFGENGLFTHIFVPTRDTIGDNMQDFIRAGETGIVTHMDGAKIARGLLYADTDDVRYLENLGAEVVPIGQYERIEGKKGRFISTDPETGEQITYFEKVKTLLYDMEELFKKEIKGLILD